MFYKNLLVYITAMIDYENERLFIDQVNNYKYSSDEFIKVIQQKQQSLKNDNIELFCIFSSPSDIEEIKDNMNHRLNKIAKQIINANEFNPKNIYDILPSDDSIEQKFYSTYINTVINENSFKYPRMFEIKHATDNLSCLCMYFTESPEENKEIEVENAIKLFIRNERPFLMGKQIMINSFIFQDIKNRKILAVLPNFDGDGWYALLEGGIKLYLNDDIPYMREKIGRNDLGVFTNLDIDSMLNNPCYAYKKFFTPYELFEEWNNVLKYLLAILPIEYDKNTLQNIYEDFMKFIENNICITELVNDSIISKEQFIEVLLVHIGFIRKYIKGLEETGISKNLILLIKNKYIYFPTLYKIIEKYYPKEVTNRNKEIKFSPTKWKTLLDKVKTEETNYDKGIALENVANYFISSLKGIKVTGKRVKTENEEIDLVCCNFFEDLNLSDLGAVILVECKNRQTKIEAKIIRNLAYLMDKKGINSILLFTKNGITKGAQLEMNKCAAHNKFFIVFDLSDLESLISENNTPYNLLTSKITDLINFSTNNSYMDLLM